MRTANELYNAYDRLIDECKANICNELQRVGKTELVFTEEFSILVESAWWDEDLLREKISSISITESSNLYYLLNDCGDEIEIDNVIKSEWLYLWEKVEEECRNIPTAYFTECAYHNKENNRLVYNLGDDVEETKVEGEQQAKEQLIYNYQQFVIDNAPLDYLPVFFLCVRESGQYKRLYAVLSNSLAEGMGYTQTELHTLKKSLKHPVICVPK
jgi:hypothetical protein